MNTQYTFATSNLHTTYPLPSPRGAQRPQPAPCGLSRQQLRDIVAQMVG
ncbi:hypothetical protein J2792_003186 [Novosphingobium capsulatum]|uniref:Uncharacterized protein n=1 Tax=Novosphingobium capsulatum TaxID=13688 RepID=A0ABU1MPN3_9SPHN|nr:hypothetical protein [Novosphingobium capsulatum]